MCVGVWRGPFSEWTRVSPGQLCMIQVHEQSDANLLTIGAFDCQGDLQPDGSGRPLAWKRLVADIWALPILRPYA